MNDVNKGRSSFDRSIIKIGSTTLILVIIAGFLPSLYLYFWHDVSLSFSQMGSAALSIWLVYLAFYFVEPFSYFPSLGLSGSYMGWLSGSVGNMRVPAVVVAKEECQVDFDSKEAEIVGIYALSGSVVSNIIVLTIGVFLGAKILAILPDVVVNALNRYLLPGIFGGMLGRFGSGRLKIAIPAFFGILILSYLARVKGLIPIWIVLFLSVFGTIGFARILYKKGKLD